MKAKQGEASKKDLPPTKPGQQQPAQSQPEDPIPLPPGFLPNSIDYDSSVGCRIIRETRIKREKSLTFSGLMSAIQPIFISFIMSGPFALSHLWNIVNNGIRSLFTAFSMKENLQIMNRLYCLAIGLGLLLFSAWRMMKMGFFGNEIDEVKIQELKPYLIHAD